MEQVPFVDLVQQYHLLKTEILSSIERVFEQASFIMGEHVETFERHVSTYIQQEAVSCASGSDALLLSLMAMGIQPGDEVITTPFTFFATSGAVVRAGARPVFVDIDKETYNIDCTKIEAAITTKTKALLVVHLFGQSANMDAVLPLSKKYGLKVIEDACQAFGGEYDGKKLGTLGDFGCFSFFPTKNLGGAGDGGLVTCKSSEDLETIKKLRVHGAKKKYFHELVGFNSRLDAIQAAILDVKLPHIEEWNGRRRSIAQKYSDALHPQVQIPKEAPKAKHIFHQYPILVPERDKLFAHLEKQGIACAVYYPEPLHLQQCFANLGCIQGDFPVAEDVSQKILSIPIFPEMTDKQVASVIDAIKEFFTERI